MGCDGPRPKASCQPDQHAEFSIWGSGEEVCRDALFSAIRSSPSSLRMLAVDDVGLRVCNQFTVYCIGFHAHDRHSYAAPVLLWPSLLFVSRSQFVMACPSFVAPIAQPYHENKFHLMSEDDKLQTLRDSVLSLRNCVASMGQHVDMGRQHNWFNPLTMESFIWDNATNEDNISMVKEGVLALHRDISVVAHHTSQLKVALPDLSVLENSEPGSTEPPRKRPARTL